MQNIFTLTRMGWNVNLAVILNFTIALVTGGRIESVEAPVAQCDVFKFDTIYHAAVESIKAELLKKGGISQREANLIKAVEFQVNCAVYNALGEQDASRMQECFNHRIQIALQYLPNICAETNCQAKSQEQKVVPTQEARKNAITMAIKLGYDAILTTKKVGKREEPTLIKVY